MIQYQLYLHPCQKEIIKKIFEDEHKRLDEKFKDDPVYGKALEILSNS